MRYGRETKRGVQMLNEKRILCADCAVIVYWDCVFDSRMPDAPKLDTKHSGQTLDSRRCRRPVDFLQTSPLPLGYRANLGFHGVIGCEFGYHSTIDFYRASHSPTASAMNPLSLSSLLLRYHNRRDQGFPRETKVRLTTKLHLSFDMTFLATCVFACGWCPGLAGSRREGWTFPILFHC